MNPAAVLGHDWLQLMIQDMLYSLRGQFLPVKLISYYKLPSFVLDSGFYSQCNCKDGLLEQDVGGSQQGWAIYLYLIDIVI